MVLHRVLLSLLALPFSALATPAWWGPVPEGVLVDTAADRAVNAGLYVDDHQIVERPQGRAEFRRASYKVEGDPMGIPMDVLSSVEFDPSRQEVLVQYAPRVWLHSAEEYFPSSVEFGFPSMTRFVGPDGNYWVRSTIDLDSPSDDSLAFFLGDLDDAPVYAYYADKGNDIVDLVYFFYYPYNRGKEVVDTIWGNHVGDWEHITVRLMRGPDDALTPLQVYLSAHSFGGAYDWADIERLDTHPVVYSAKGSHGVWSTPGDHVYMSIGEEVLGVCVTLVCTDLTDLTDAGIAWDTWENVAGFDHGAKEGLAGQTWPVWMSEDFKAPGAQPVDVPGGGAIFRWGNEEDCSTLGVDISDLIGVCRLEDGPTGPVSKDTWGPMLQ